MACLSRSNENSLLATLTVVFCSSKPKREHVSQILYSAYSITLRLSYRLFVTIGNRFKPRHNIHKLFCYRLLALLTIKHFHLL